MKINNKTIEWNGKCKNNYKGAYHWIHELYAEHDCEYENT